MIQNDPNSRQTYKGFEVTLNKRFSQKWMMLAGYTYSRPRLRDLSIGTSPNAFLNTEGPIFNDRPQQFKLSGSYLLPLEVDVGATLRVQSGPPINRQISAPLSFGGGSTTINVEPQGAHRLDPLRTIDVRIAKTFRLAENRSVEANLDIWLSIVDEALRESGLAPQHLDLEITESVIITHPEKAVATLIKLKQMGVSITVDDFGTGYSSLSYLARLPLQGFKIDQRFIHGLEQNRNDEAITQAIIALSHSLGLRCIAQGVETPAQWNFLKTHGCEEAQGFLISHPLTEADLRSWWRIQEELREGSARQGDLWQR